MICFEQMKRLIDVVHKFFDDILYIYIYMQE